MRLPAAAQAQTKVRVAQQARAAGRSQARAANQLPASRAARAIRAALRAAVERIRRQAKAHWARRVQTTQTAKGSIALTAFVAKARVTTAAVSATSSTWRGLARRFQTAKQRWLRIPSVPPTQLLPVSTMACATAPAAVATTRTVRRAAILPAIRAPERWLAGRTATARAPAPPKPRFRALHSSAMPPAPLVRTHAAAT